MSKSRIIARFMTVTSVALLTARLAVWFFPLQAPAQAVSDSSGITVDAGGALMHRTPVFSTSASTGTVRLEATLNSKGEVTDAHVLSGPDELRKAALQSVIQWHYSTLAGVSSPVRITIKFAGAQPGGPGAAVAGGMTMPRLTAQTTLTKIEFLGVSVEVENMVRARLPVKEGDPLTPAALARVREVARDVDEHFLVLASANPARTETTLLLSLGLSAAPPPTVAGGVQGGAPSGVLGGIISAAPPPPPPPPPARVDAGGPDSPRRIRVGANVQAANLISQVSPAYPPLAMQARVQGQVQFTAIIGKDGTVKNLQLISGHPLLVPAATEAVKQWVYKPTLLNGEPVEVITQIDVNFTLSQ